jgi:hypothetical protein
MPRTTRVTALNCVRIHLLRISIIFAFWFQASMPTRDNLCQAGTFSCGLSCERAIIWIKQVLQKTQIRVLDEFVGS